MKKMYLTKLSIWQCKKILSDKMLFGSVHGMLEVRHIKEAIIFKIHFYKACAKLLTQFDEFNKEARITITYKAPMVIYFGIVSNILILLLFIRGIIFPDKIGDTYVGIYGACVMFFFLCLGVAGSFAARINAFKIADAFMSSKLSVNLQQQTK